MRVDLLASGSKGNACVVRDGTTCILIDCGSTRKYLKEALNKVNVRMEDIDAVLITHDHGDHIAQIRMFKDLTIYSPVEIDGVDTLHVVAMKSFVIETLKITPLALSHDALHTTGYIFESGSEKLVYITDTGYLKYDYIPMLKEADIIVLESNHDVDMLMHSHRPQYVKSRIYSDDGHLCNEDCAEILDQIVSRRTKAIFLAHISQEANTRQKALDVTCNVLKDNPNIAEDLVVAAAGQFEILTKGESDEETCYGTVCRNPYLEYHS